MFGVNGFSAKMGTHFHKNSKKNSDPGPFARRRIRPDVRASGRPGVRTSGRPDVRTSLPLFQFLRPPPPAGRAGGPEAAAAGPRPGRPAAAAKIAKKNERTNEKTNPW